MANSDCSFEDWIQNNPSQQEKVAFASQNVGMKLKDIEPLTIESVISQNTKFLNNIRKNFPQDEIPIKLNYIVQKQWNGESLYF